MLSSSSFVMPAADSIWHVVTLVFLVLFSLCAFLCVLVLAFSYNPLSRKKNHLMAGVFISFAVVSGLMIIANVTHQTTVNGWYDQVYELMDKQIPLETLIEHELYSVVEENMVTEVKMLLEDGSERTLFVDGRAATLK